MTNPTQEDGNPYGSPKATGVDVDQADSDPPRTDAAENLLFSARLVRIMSVFAGVISLLPLLNVGFAYRYYGFANQPTSWLLFILARLLFVPLCLLAARTGWRYAREMTRCAGKGLLATDASVELRATLWLCVCGIALVAILVFVLRIAYFFTAAQPINTY